MILATSFGERTIFKYEFPLMGSVRVPPVAEHYQTFMGRQDCDSQVNLPKCNSAISMSF